MFRIVFTGHRDKRADPAELDRIARAHPGAIWIHGAARGFDQQISQYARRHDIPQEAHPPDYATHGKAAPLIRNRAMIDQADHVIACYDGRTTGGTFYTINQARRHGIPVQILTPTG